MTKHSIFILKLIAMILN